PAVTCARKPNRSSAGSPTGMGWPWRWSTWRPTTNWCVSTPGGFRWCWMRTEKCWTKGASTSGSCVEQCGDPAGGSAGDPVEAGLGGGGGVGRLLATFLPSFGAFLATLFAAFAFDEAAVDQGLVLVGSAETYPLERDHGRQLFRAERAPETGHALSDCLAGVPVGAA